MILSQITKTGEMPSYALDKMNASIIDSKAMISETIESIFKSEKSAVRDAKQNPNGREFFAWKGDAINWWKSRSEDRIEFNKD